MKIYTIYDQKAEAYLSPFFLPTNAAAIRSISDLVNDITHQEVESVEEDIVHEGEEGSCETCERRHT